MLTDGHKAIPALRGGLVPHVQCVRLSGHRRRLLPGRQVHRVLRSLSSCGPPQKQRGLPTHLSFFATVVAAAATATAMRSRIK